MKLGAAILAGGASRRMGVDKAALPFGGARAVDAAVALAAAVGAEVTVVAGGADYGLPRVLDPTPFGGPVGGVLAAAARLVELGCGRMLVLAVDTPLATAADVAPLLAACPAAYEGLPLPFVTALADLPTAPADWPLHRLLDAWGVRRIDCPTEVAARLRGANTPAEWGALNASICTLSSAAPGPDPGAERDAGSR